jgi:predicted transcriptional regulator
MAEDFNKTFGEQSSQEDAELTKLLTDPALLNRIKQELDRWVVGEDENKLLLWLIAASSMTAWNMSAIINGSSSAGKSWLKSHVLQYFNNVETYTRLTRAAPDRLGQDFTKKILDVEELRGSEAAQSTLRVWISEGNLKLLTTTINENGKMDTTVIETRGSPTFITTCTNAEIDDELLNRMVILSLDETTRQTKEIIRFEAKQYCQLGDVEEEEKPNQLFAAALARLTWIDRVIIPYADCLAEKFPIPKGAELSVGPRRDFKKLLHLIGVVAWIHQKQRTIVTHKELQEKAAKALGKQFILASPVDFYMVWKICRHGFLQTLFKLSERHKRILEVFNLEKGRTVKDVAEQVNLSENRAREFLKSLVNKGYLSVDRSQKIYVYTLKQKNEMEGTIDDFVDSLRVFQQTQLQTWLESHNYKILQQPLAQPSFVDPFTGQTEDSADRILCNIKTEPQKDTEQPIAPPEDTKPSTEPQQTIETKQNAETSKTLKLERLRSIYEDKCVNCGAQGRVDWQITNLDGTWALLCGPCGEKIAKQQQNIQT